MDQLFPLTPVQLSRAEQRLRHPAPGSRIEAARDYGIDLTLLIEQLRLTPAQRARKLEAATSALEQVRGAARNPPAAHRTGEVLPALAHGLPQPTQLR